MKRIILLSVLFTAVVSFAIAGGQGEKAKAPAAGVSESAVEQMGKVNSNPLSDVRVRKAIAYAIDMEAIIDGLMGGNAILANSLVPNNSWKAEGLEYYKYNPDKARELLAEANWDPGYELDLAYYYGDQLTVDICTAFQSYLADVGVKCSIRKIEGDTGVKLYSVPADMTNGPSAVDWDLVYGAIAAPTNYEYYTRFTSTSTVNSHTPKYDRIDELMDQANGTVKYETQKKIFDELQRIENKFLPVYSLYYQQFFTVQSTRLTRNGAMYGNEQFNYDWKIQTWDIEPDESGKKVMKTNGGPAEFFDTVFKTPGLYMPNKVLFDHLIVANGDFTEFRPQMASDYSVSEDGKEFKFKLKRGLKWHDGSEVTPEDVKFTFEIAAKTTPLQALFENLISSLEGYDEYMDDKSDEISGITIEGDTITFKLAKIYPNALLSFSQLPPLPRKYLKDANPLLMQRDKFWQWPIGSGPYMLKEVEMNDYTILVPFKDYHEGVPIIEEIQAYPSTESDPNLVKNAIAGELDHAFTKSVEHVESLKNVSNMKIIPCDVNYTRILYFNKFPKK